jgi:N-acetylmuramoyl-L-alanine amidase
MLPAFVLCALVAAREPWTVVIDPGHGGYQPGAHAGGGKYEKQLTLLVAQRLKNQLEAKGFTVFMTRDSDKYVSLGGRSRFANERHADVLVSIHANDSKNTAANGIETYFLAQDATDAEALALAEKENDDPNGDDDNRDLLHTILSDLRRSNAQIESELLAARLQGAVVRATGAKSRGVKRAPLAVLKRTEMAAVLVEIGFLTSADERTKLWSEPYEEQLATGLASGIERFLTDVQSGGTPELPPQSEAPYVSLDRRKAAKAAPKIATTIATTIATKIGTKVRAAVAATVGTKSAPKKAPPKKTAVKLATKTVRKAKKPTTKKAAAHSAR